MAVDNSKLVSVIVPVYNVESFFEHCITSILEQTYTNLELILIDDGSTDTSGQMCDEWQKMDSRIIVHHQKNQGLSAARNRGLDLAKGDYICFVDSDDFVTKNYLESFVDEIETTNADFVFCDIVSSKLVDASIDLDKNTVLTPKECAKWLTNPLSREYVLMVVACNKIFRRELFDTYRFAYGKLHEDEFMINHMLYNIKKAVYISKANYVYRNNEESITGKGNSSNVKHLHAIEAYEERINMAMNRGDEEFAAITLKWALLKLAYFYRDGNETMKEHSKELFVRIYDKYRALFTRKQQVKYRLFKEAPVLFCKVFLG